MGKTIKQTIQFSGTPHQVYEILMDSALHTKLVGDKAEISREVGGPIDVYHGFITGENLELVPDKKIVQTWHASDWPEGHDSVATFEFENDGGGTRMIFTQTNVPDDHFEDISNGWHEHYWSPLEAMLKGEEQSSL